MDSFLFLCKIILENILSCNEKRFLFCTESKLLAIVRNSLSERVLFVQSYLTGYKHIWVSSLTSRVLFPFLSIESVTLLFLLVLNDHRWVQEFDICGRSFVFLLVALVRIFSFFCGHFFFFLKLSCFTSLHSKSVLLEQLLFLAGKTDFSD